MLVTKIDSYVADGLNRLLQQYRGKSKIEGFYTAFLQQFQALEDGAYPVAAGREIWNGIGTPAIGEQLDNIGVLVGIDRNGLSDEEYILFIFGKIAQNNSETTITDVLNVVGYLFQAPTVIIQEIFPAGVAIEIVGTPIAPRLYPIAKQLIKASLGAGIELIFAAVTPAPYAFRFAYPGVNGALEGFGDLLNPSIGGVFVGLIE